MFHSSFMSFVDLDVSELLNNENLAESFFFPKRITSVMSQLLDIDWRVNLNINNELKQGWSRMALYVIVGRLPCKVWQFTLNATVMVFCQ